MQISDALDKIHTLAPENDVNYTSCSSLNNSLGFPEILLASS